MIEAGAKTGFYYFRKPNGERVYEKNATIMADFYYCGRDFFLLEKGDLYQVCISIDGELTSVWKHSKKEDGLDYRPSEAMSDFRKHYTRNKVNETVIQEFLADPVLYWKNR